MKKFGKQIVFLTLLLGATSIATAQIQLTLPTVTGKPGTEAVIAVLVNDLTPYDVQGYQLKLKYNKDLIYLKEPLPSQKTGSLTSPTYTDTVRVDSSAIVVTAATSGKFSGQGVLFKLRIMFRKLGSTNITLDPAFDNMFIKGSQTINYVLVPGKATVATVNNPPVFDPITPKTVNENQELKFTVNAVDPEGDPITYSAQYNFNGPSFNPATKEFVWKPTFAQSGTYTVTFSANDGTSTATTTVGITVIDVNTAPVITPITDKTINEGSTLIIDVLATDAEGDVLTYSAAGTPQGAQFDPATRKFTWTPSFLQSGNYTVTFSVSDGKLSASINVKITVIDVNAAPVITPIADKTVNTGQTLTFDVIATDADGDVLTYGHSTLPQGASFDVNTKKFSWKPSGTQAGDYEITFFVSDGKETTSLKVKIKVIKVNSAPVFDSKTISDTTISVHNVNMLFKYQFKATDPDGDVVTFRIDGDSPSGSTLSSSGAFNWITNSSHASRVYMFMITASDGTLSETKVVTITVRQTVVGVEDEIIIPTKFNLAQNYPNPFNPTTNIKYSLPKESNVVLKIYNVMGEEIRTLVNGYRPAGTHTVKFDASGLTSGLYFYKIQTNESSKTMKMLLTK
ncbi:MAG: Peptidase S8 and S53 subtilisin kexin sedolisin [Ignavibacteria bacterium]|nr:MAG: Peptidase S8 and S53 subtilisin kexin sedolisin [Ignavibacteria bacterium]KAF0160981.1 MAG: Peptidase S8 and S53 subtilisin kexin sedolisin [Ignavibacteria bacterium]